MTYHAQGTLGGVWVTLSDHQTTFLVLHGEPESMFLRLTFDIFTSKCCQAYHHDRLAERSSKPPLNLSLLEGGSGT